MGEVIPFMSSIEKYDRTPPTIGFRLLLCCYIYELVSIYIKIHLKEKNILKGNTQNLVLKNESKAKKYQP